MQNTVSIKWLLARMFEPDLVIADCRFWLNDPLAGRQNYNEAHIPRAIYLDLEEDLSSPVSTHGGRHPLPEPEQMARIFGRAGLSQDDRIVIYDDNNGMNAARLWWMLTYLGHNQVYILEQDFSVWKQAGYPVTDEQPVVVPKTFEARPQKDIVVDVDYVRQVSERLSGSGSTDAEQAGNVNDTTADHTVSSNEADSNIHLNTSIVLIDSRAHNRYLGLEEPLDKKAGHIPGATNFFWQDVLTEAGSLKSAEQLEEQFAGLDKNAEIIVYCGSGVSACPNVFALKQLGFENVKLYPGSWSDWISYEDNPIATGEEV
ncbi:sulfurtransferase [Paenibacillus wulumuqiensis]|uniref:sulfurtransferase n=1 Tax=Paenibacillus wulumuqiensis TaxID=1567107 RepID=UPI000619407C|nr:sulfurtransferase [Paenibacillus wulumuqiensis]